MTANLRLRVPFHHWIPFLSILQQPGMRRNAHLIPITVMESCVPISVSVVVFHLLLRIIYIDEYHSASFDVYFDLTLGSKDRVWSDLMR